MGENSLTITELNKLVGTYREYILKFTKALQNKFNVPDNPIHYVNDRGVVPKKGELVIDNEKVTYNYHGAGCSIDYNGVLIDFDVLPYDSTIKVSSWKFQQFLLSYLNLNEDEISTARAEVYLQMLVK